MDDGRPLERRHEEPYRPERVYLSASNWLFLALKVTGYAFIGSLVISLPLLVLFIGLNIHTGSAPQVP